MTAQKQYDRITFSLPHDMNMALDSLKQVTHRSKSDIIKLAIESYIRKQEEERLEKAVELMSHEYADNKELTSFTSLDGEEFL